MKRIVFWSAWSIGLLACVLWATPAMAKRSLPLSSGGSFRVSLAPGALTGSLLQSQFSIRDVRRTGWLAGTLKADPALGSMQQGQTMGTNPLAPGSFGFTMMMVQIGLVAGGMIVSMGSQLAASMGGDLLGWKIASLVLEGLGFGLSVYLLSTVDMSFVPPGYSMILWMSLGLSGLSLAWGVVRLIIYVRQRDRMRRMRRIRRRHQQPPPPSDPNAPPPAADPNSDPPPNAEPPPVAILPWGGVDQNGNAMGGLALMGYF